MNNEINAENQSEESNVNNANLTQDFVQNQNLQQDNNLYQSQSNDININQTQSNEIKQEQESNKDSSDSLDSQKVVIKNQNKQEIEENRLKKFKESPYVKKINEMLEKLNQVKHIKIDSIFENIKDAHTIFSIEQRTYDFVINLNKLLIGVVIVQFILIISLFPLKEKEPYLVGFSNATQNFVHIEPANKRIFANDALVRSLVGAYILNRETINRFDDSQRYEVVRLQSSMKVWKVFENIVAQEKSIYGNEAL